MPAMVSVAAARERAGKRVERDLREWAARGGRDAELVVPLNPPTERAVLASLGAAIAWSRQWEGVDGVLWAQRQWPSAGSQRVPERLVLRGADAITAFAGPARLREWRLIEARAETLRSTFASASTSSTFAAAVRTHARTILELEPVDFDRLVHVVSWLVEHPASGWRVRQLPIRGVDTKWLGRHRAVVESLHAALTGGESLGLLPAPSLVRVRFLDPALRPGGLGDVASPIDDLAALDVRPDVVLVFENLETVLALPPLPGAVVIHGGGFGAGDRLSRIPWVAGGRVVYWGDLDSHGFAILNQLRSTLPKVTSVLMDTAALLAHRDLWVPEPKPAVGEFPLLARNEQEALARLRSEGNVRLEQERIEWAYALNAVRAAL